MERFIMSVATWVALWGEASPANVVTGFVVSLVLWRLFPPAKRVNHGIRAMGAARFVGRFLVDLVTSSFAVALTVLRPTGRRLEVKVVEVTLHTDDPLMLTVICNAMTLTPGTMTVSVDEATSVMKLHVLGDIGTDEVERHVLELEERVLSALRSIPPRRGRA
jgi:multicomponent Na+:H+ antiporter subunit E